MQVQAASYDARRDDTATRIVIDAAQLRQYGDPALLDVLKRLPGISVGQGAPGRSGTLSLRGLGAGYTQILINGQKAPLGFDLDALSPEMVERVEILRAPSVDQGMGAIAGTLNIVTRAPVAKDTQRLTVSWADTQGRIVQCNGATSAMFGHPMEALLGQRIQVLMSDQEQQQHDGYMAQYLSSGVARIWPSKA